MFESDYEISETTIVMIIKIETYSQNEFLRLRTDWERLQKGEEMTYFQTWDWNHMLLRGVPKDSAHFETIFLVVKHNGIAEMIVPLWIIKKRYHWVHRPMIYLFGYGGWSDYLNCIYYDFREEIMDAVIDFIQKRYPSIPLYFTSLQENSSLYRYILKHYILLTNIQRDCVSVILPDTIEQWYQTLSKSTRQNLRTAKNRMNRDGIYYTVTFDDHTVDKQICIANRARRSKMKSIRDTKVNWIKQLKRHLKTIYCALPSQGGYLPILDDPHAKIMTLSTIDGNLMAYFHYGYDEIHNEIVVISAGVMEGYERYSPGMVLMQAYIESAINKRKLRVIDFTRGDEPYKLALGGKRKINNTVKFCIK